MTVTLELKPEIEARVAEQAEAYGLTVEVYIQRVLESVVAEPPTDPRERLLLFEELQRSHAQTNTGLRFTPRIVGETAPAKDRSKEQAWLTAHRGDYAGEWVALDGDRLLGHGSNLKEVAEAARDAGVKDALIARVESSHALPYIGI